MNQRHMRESCLTDANQISIVWFFGGLLLILAVGLCYVFVGDSILVSPHDQLDGEILTYMLHVEHWGASNYNELMGGIPATGMHMAAPGLVLLYLLLPPVYAFSLGCVLVAIIAYCGLWLLVRFFEVRPWIAVVSSLLFASVPFYSVYGLSIMGVPLIAWAVCRSWCSRSHCDYIAALTAVAFYAFFSSLVLSGFAVCFGVIVVIIASLLTKPKARMRTMRLCVLLGVLCFVYFLENMDLIIQVLFGKEVLSHKSEIVLSVIPLSMESFLTFLKGGAATCYIKPTFYFLSRNDNVGFYYYCNYL